MQMWGGDDRDDFDDMLQRLCNLYLNLMFGFIQPLFKT